jgi:hypothetical protein
MSWFQDFRLGLDGIADATLGTHWAADIYATQTAEQQGLTSDQEAALALEKQNQEDTGHVLDQAAAATADQIAAPIVNTVGSLWKVVNFVGKYGVYILVGGVLIYVATQYSPQIAGNAAKAKKAVRTVKEA